MQIRDVRKKGQLRKSTVVGTRYRTFQIHGNNTFLKNVIEKSKNETLDKGLCFQNFFQKETVSSQID